MCSLYHVHFLVLLENLTCFYKTIMSSPGNFEVFMLDPGLLENLMRSRNLFKNVAPGKKEQNFSKIAGCFWVDLHHRHDLNLSPI